MGQDRAFVSDVRSSHAGDQRRNHQDVQHVVVDLVDDPVVPGTDPPFTLTADQFLGPARPRLIGEELDGRLDASSGGRVELAQLT